MESRYIHSPITRPEPSQSQDGGAAQDASARLGELVDELLRRALRAGDGTANGQVREALRRACEAAQERGLHAEEVLVILKARWSHLPEALQVARDDGQALFARLITLCICEYYDPPRREG